MKPVWSLSFWSLHESRISKIKVIGFMGQSCHSESSGYLSNHATFMDHESDISCNEKLYSYNIARGKEITVPWGHHHTATMHQLQEQEEQQQGKAIQLRWRRPQRREDWRPLLGPRSVLPMPGPTESECGLCPGGIMGVLVSNNYIMAWWMQNASFTLQSKGCSESNFNSNCGYLQAVSFRATLHKPFGWRIVDCLIVFPPLFFTLWHF